MTELEKLIEDYYRDMAQIAQAREAWLPAEEVLKSSRFKRAAKKYKKWKRIRSKKK